MSGDRGDTAALMKRETIAAAFGNIFWLMHLSPAHRERPVRSIEDVVLPALLHGSFKLVMKDKQPVAFVSWASMSDDVKARFNAGEALELADWKSGPTFVITECISPFMPEDQVKAKVMAALARGPKDISGDDDASIH